MSDRHLVSPAWHRINDDHGCRVVWAVPDRPRAGWVACYRSRQDAETGECSRALLLRADEFARVLTDRIVPPASEHHPAATEQACG